jgi:PAS domain S-box-containing protein
MQSTFPGILAKTLLLVSTLVCVLTVSFIGLSFKLVTANFQQLEREGAGTDLERLVNEITNIRHRIESSVADWAPWDATHAFVAQGNQEYVDNNLADETFETLGLHCMLFFDADNRLVHSRFHDLDRHQQTEMDAKVVAAVQGLPELFDFTSTRGKKSTLLLAGSTPILVAAAPIVTSTFEGPIGGTLVFGRFLDQALLQRISATTKLRVGMARYDAATHNELLASSIDSPTATAKPPRAVAFQALDSNTLLAHTLLSDGHGQPALVMTINLERRIVEQGLAMWRDHALATVFLGAVFLLSLVVLLNRLILRRLTHLGDEVGMIADAGSHELRVTVPGRDEIGSLAMRINGMLTSLQRLQQLLQHSELYLTTIIDSIHCGIMIVDAEQRRIQSINKAGALMSGYAAEDIVGRICHQLICPQAIDHCPVLDDGEIVDLSERLLLHADGRRIPILKSVACIEQDGRTLLIESFIDISPLKKMQADLAASESKYRQFFEDDLTGNFIATADGLLVDCNPAFARILGYCSPNEVIGSSMEGHLFNSEQRDLMLNRLRAKGKLDRYEGALRHCNGQPVYIVGNLIGIFDDQGELTSIRGYLFDDTKRVLLEKEIRQNQKLEAIGTMAGGIAHDFNNILAGIIGYTELVLRDLDQQQIPRSRRNLENILNAGERARGLIEKMLTFSRQTEGERRPVNLQQALEEVLQLIRVSLPATIAIKQRVLANATVQADPIQMHQVFMNLCTNAGHAMKKQGGTLSITLDTVHLDADFTARHPELTIGDYARIRIADTGKGIPEQLLSRIFDPFFTTKKKGEGTGLGLSMVHGIVSAMHGLITVESHEGAGSCFTVSLPISQEEEAMEDAPQQAIPTGHEHVVYVDDQQFLVDIATEILRGLGYTVTGFIDSEKALDFLRSHAAEVDLVISDMTMPQLTGQELARELQNLPAPPPIIICTGHNEGLSRAQLLLIGVHELLLKPVTVKTLATTVREVLDKTKMSAARKPQRF